MRFGYGNTHLWLCKNTGTMNRSPTPGGMFATNFVGVRHVIGSLSAAVGADLSRPHIQKPPHTMNNPPQNNYNHPQN